MAGATIFIYAHGQAIPVRDVAAMKHETYALSIDDDRCVRCHNCEGVAPGFRQHIKTHGRLLIASGQIEDIESEVHRMLEHCYLDALILVKVER